MKKEKSLADYKSIKEAYRGSGHIDQSINMDYVSPIAKYQSQHLRNVVTRWKNYLVAKKKAIIEKGGVWLEWCYENKEQLYRITGIIKQMREANNMENCKCAKCKKVLGSQPTYEAHVRKNYNGLLGLCDDCENEIVPFK